MIKKPLNLVHVWIFVAVMKFTGSSNGIPPQQHVSQFILFDAVVVIYFCYFLNVVTVIFGWHNICLYRPTSTARAQRTTTTTKKKIEFTVRE